MLPTEAELLAILGGIRTRDEVLGQIADAVADVLGAWAPEGTPRLFVVDLSGVQTDPPPVYFTPNCVALTLGPCIVINERFLLEIEGAIRAFGGFASLSHCPFARSENDMFALVRRLEGRLPGYLARLRRVDAGGPRWVESFEALKLVTLFFVAHELGHLERGGDGRRFGAYLDSTMALERRVDLSVVKMCRHLDEFREHGFGLDGDRGGGETDRQIRFEERHLRSEDHQRAVAWFADEAAADATGTALLVEYLAGSSVETAHAFSRGLFAAGMLGWFRDLMHYCAACGVEPFSAQRLSLKMLESKRLYVQAASLFGNHHRFTLLRAVLTLERMLGRLPGVVDATDVEDPALRQRMAECRVRELLLRRLMDTGVKLATIGCANGWLLKLEDQHGPKPFLMMFYSLGYEMEQIYGPLPPL